MGNKTAIDEEMTLSEIQRCCLKILHEFTKFCDDNGLRYFLVGGAALGAIRHKGIIPWDDDIDVGLFRSDYDFFCKHFQDSADYRLFTMDRESDYYNPFAKLCATETEYIEPTSRSVIGGVFIDVFPIDYISDSRISVFRGVCAARCYTHSFRLDLNAEKYRKEPLPKRVFRRLTGQVYKGRNAREIANRITRGIASSTPTEHVMNIWGAWGMREIMKTQWFGEGVMVPFEDMECRVPAKWDEYLSTLYGDYMMPPSKPPKYHGIAYKTRHTSKLAASENSDNSVLEE